MPRPHWKTRRRIHFTSFLHFFLTRRERERTNESREVEGNGSHSKLKSSVVRVDITGWGDPQPAKFPYEPLFSARPTFFIELPIKYKPSTLVELYCPSISVFLIRVITFLVFRF
jgi:hypothetical protein